MTRDKFRYHKYLQTIADDDVQFLMKKDRSYGASWKESGRSAWFMVKRMMDRLGNMMARPVPPLGFSMTNVDDTITAIMNGSETRASSVEFPGSKEATVLILRHIRDCYLSEDLLARMESEKLSNEDGTVCAVLRDMRRYALLAEAEIMDRLAPAEDKVSHVRLSLDTTELRKVLKEEHAKLCIDEGTREVPVEDSNKHAERARVNYPWAVDEKWRFDHNYHDKGRAHTFDRWWTKRALNVWVPCGAVFTPETGGDKAGVPDEIVGLYDIVGQFYVLKVALCPPALRANYTKISTECNSVEYERLPSWCHGLYDWDDNGTKWRIKREHEGWTRW